MQDGTVTEIKAMLDERLKSLVEDMTETKRQLAEAPPAKVKEELEKAQARQADRLAALEAARQLIPDRAKAGGWADRLVDEARAKSLASMTRHSDGGVKGHDLIDLCRVKSVVSVDGGELATGGRYYDPNLIVRRHQKYRFVDLIPQIQIGEDETYVVDAESSRGGDSGAHGFVDQSGGAASGDSTITLDDVSGLGAGQLLRLHLSGSTVEKSIASIGASPSRVVTITGTFGTAIPDGTRWSTYRDFTATAEKGAYPQTLIEVAPTTLTLQDLGILLRCTERSLARSNVRQHTFTRLLAKLRRNLNRHLLYGTGANRTLHGILTNASLTNVAWSGQWSGATRGETAYSAAVDCLSDMDPVILLHPNDWKKIVAEKSSAGGYLHAAGSPIAVVDGKEVKQLGPYAVETDGDLNEGDGLAFSPEECSALVTADEGTLAAGTVAPGIERGYIDDDFARSQFALRARQKAEHAVKIPEAARSIEFDQAPS